jgi:chromosome segregation ATPase
MTDPSTAPGTPDVAETASFLRRFAGMMSVGQNATSLLHAAVLLETLEARLTAATDEEQLWRYKYETMTHHADELEAECNSLKHDIDGHLDIISTTLSERSALAITLQGREAELSELRAAFDREAEALKTALKTHGDELDQHRDVLQREREQRAAELKTHEGALSELGHERDDLRVQLKVREDELAALRAVTSREHDGLREKIAALETKRAELRSAFDRISHLRDRAAEYQTGDNFSFAGKPGAEVDAKPLQPQRNEWNPAIGEADTVVPKATLRQARAQFKHLAGEFTGIGDVASRVMCELGAHSMDQALGAGREAGSLAVGDTVLGILASSGSTALDRAESK